MPIDYSFSEDHEALRATLRAFLGKSSDEKNVRAAMTSERGFDPELWKRLASELGLVGLIVPEALGGSGFGAIELLIAMEEMGRALLCAPYLGTAVLGASALLSCADSATQHELLPLLAQGKLVTGVAFAEPNGR